MATFTKLPSGSVRVQIRRAGFYRSETFPTKAQAKAFAQSIEGQIADVRSRGYHLPKDLTVNGLLKLYREHHPGKAWGASKDNALSRWGARLGEIRLGALSAIHLRDYVDQRVAEGVAGSTIAGDLSTLAAVFAWGREVRRLDVNPELPRETRRAMKHRQGLATRSRERDRRPTSDELALLHKHFATPRPNQHLPMATLIRFAIASGMRLGEICRIRAADVDSVRRTVVIRDRKDPRHKVGNDQEVPLLGEAWAIVQPRLDRRGRLFAYSAGSVSAAFSVACRKLGIEDLHFHDLRHEAITRLFEQGYSVPEVALVSGHKNWKNLQRYTQLRPESLHREVVS